MVKNRKNGYALAVMCTVSLCSLICRPLHAADRGGIRTLPDHVTEKSVKSIRMGIKYLVRTQRVNGSWNVGGGYYSSYPVVMTSLAGLALMAHGSTPESGPYARNVSHAMDYVLNVAESQMKGGSKSVVIASSGSRSMYSHGFGMLFLAQCYGMEKDKERGDRIKKVLEAAVKLTASSQSDLGSAKEHAGGWTYSPQSKSDEGSVTVTQLQALRACRNVGISVPGKTIQRVVTYLRYMQRPDGGICYSSGSTGNSQPAVSAAAIACFYAAGVYDRGTEKSKAEALMVKKLVNYCKRISPNSGGGHYFYTHFYKSQGLYQRGGKDWKEYYPRLRDRIIGMQMPDGSWNGDHVGPVYGTSIALVILQLPYGRLPIYQKQ